MRVSISILFAAAILIPLPLAAKSTPIQTDVAENWLHEQSKIGLPALVGDFGRGSVEDLSSSQSDIAATYRHRPSSTLASVYVFRAGIADVSIWQDRINHIITANPDRYGQFDLANRLEANFTPASGGENSGLRFILPVSGKSMTSTGSAVLAVDQWMIAVRMSSGQLNAAELDAKLSTFMAGLQLPKAASVPQAAYQITDCISPLPTKAAKRVKADIADAMIMGALGGAFAEIAAEDQKDDPPEPAGRFCRGLAGGASYDAYVREGEPESYLVAFGDAGTTAEVAPNLSAVLPSKPQQFVLTLHTAEQSLFFQGFKKLPSVAQVIQAVNSERPIGGSGRTPENAKTINIIMPAK